MYIDTHCHLSRSDYEDINDVIKSAFDNDVKKIVISGCEKNNLLESINISNNNSNVFLTLGYHPSEADKITDEDINDLEEYIVNNKKVVAVGEIGLDYHWNKENKERQKNLFKKMLKLAQKLNLPVVIHSRDAFQDTYEILKQYKVKGIIHCFSGSLECAKLYINIGFKLGIGGVITFKNTNLKEVIKEINLTDVVLETDSPYLTPAPYRGNRNEPKYIPIIANEIASIKNIKIKEVAETTTDTALKIFKID